VPKSKDSDAPVSKTINSSETLWGMAVNFSSILTNLSLMLPRHWRRHWPPCDVWALCPLKPLMSCVGLTVS